MNAAVGERLVRWARGIGHHLPTLGLGTLTLVVPLVARGMCDVIPGVTQEFRGALGTLNRPFAIPNDQGEEITIRLQPTGCDAGSLGFVELPGGLLPEDDYFVTVLFEPLKVFLSVAGLLLVAALAMLAADLYSSGGTSIGNTTILLSVASLMVFMFGLLCDQVSAMRRERHE